MARRVHISSRMRYKHPAAHNLNDNTTPTPTDTRLPLPVSRGAPSRVSSQKNAIATLPSGTNGDRRALIGALALLQAAATWTMTVAELAAWFDEYLVNPGFMPRPTYVHEHGTVHVYLDRSVTRPAQEVTLRNMLNVTRKEVGSVLEGFVEAPHDDRFLNFFVGTARVTMAPNGWQSRPCIDDRLSDIVLTLLAADILSNRRLYEDRLSVCDECGRVSFRHDRSRIPRCPMHGRAVLETILRTC